MRPGPELLEVEHDVCRTLLRVLLQKMAELFLVEGESPKRGSRAGVREFIAVDAIEWIAGF